MNKKYLALSLIVPCYLLGEVELGQVTINEEIVQETNSVDINLEKTEQYQSNSVFEIFKMNHHLNLEEEVLLMQKGFI